jgi:hypothetical protein
MMRAAMLAALIVGIAMQPAAAEPFYREEPAYSDGGRRPART